MIKGVDRLLQIFSGLLVLVNFLFPINFMENSRLNYIIYFIKNISFEVSLLFIIVIFFTTKLGVKAKEKVFKQLEEIKVLFEEKNWNIFVSINIIIIIVVGCYLGISILNTRIKHYSFLRVKYYSQGYYDAELLGKKGDLNSSIDAYNSFAVSLSKGVAEQNSIINSKIDRLKFQKRLSEDYFQNFESSFKEYGLTRISFFMLVESYCLNPYDLIIQSRLFEVMEQLENGIALGSTYYNSAISDNQQLLVELDSLHHSAFLENGILKSSKYSKQYWSEIKNLFKEFSEEEYLKYLNDSWRLGHVKGIIEIIESNKAIQ